MDGDIFMMRVIDSPLKDLAAHALQDRDILGQHLAKFIDLCALCNRAVG